MILISNARHGQAFVFSNCFVFPQNHVEFKEDPGNAGCELGIRAWWDGSAL